MNALRIDLNFLISLVDVLYKFYLLYVCVASHRFPANEYILFHGLYNQSKY